MKDYWLYIGLAFAGHAFYLLKQQLENLKRKQKFDAQAFILSEGMNIIAIFLLVYIGIQAPSDWLTMSPVVAIMIGGFGSSMLSTFINTKKPKDLDTETTTLTTTFTTPAAPKDEQLQNKT